MGLHRPYARVYYVDLARDYPTVYRDALCLGTYVQLLSVADAMWPAVPEIPRSVKAPALKVLVDVGLIIPIAPDCYGIRGLDAERNARSIAGGNAARIRWGTADGNAETMPSLAEPSQHKPSQPRNGLKPGSATMEEAFRRIGMPVDEGKK